MTGSIGSSLPNGTAGLSNAASRQSSAQRLDSEKLIDDIFNNKSPTEEGTVKLRLSHTATALYDELKDRVNTFLSKNKKLQAAVEKIPLPESKYSQTSPSADLNVRKLATYARWLKTPPQEGQEVPAEYKSVQEEQKDPEISELFNTHEEDRKAMEESRKKQSPNYFYLIYPETYSFN